MYPPIPSPRENKMKNRLYAAGSVVAWRCWRVSVLWRGKDRAGSVRLLVAEAAGHDTSRAARRACLAALKQLQPSRTMAVRRSSRSRRRSRPSDPSLDPGGVSPSRGTRSRANHDGGARGRRLSRAKRRMPSVEDARIYARVQPVFANSPKLPKPIAKRLERSFCAFWQKSRMPKPNGKPLELLLIAMRVIWATTM